MDMPINTFKRGLKEGRKQAGCWLSLASHTAAEICAGAGFDWVLVDMEHAPADLENVHHQLQAVAPYPVSAMVRPPWNDPVVIKRLLDVGVQTLLLPYVQTAEEARRAVAAIRYAPHGFRGVSTSSRANRYGRVKDYFTRVHDELCLIVQIESPAAIEQIEAIAAIDGIDGLFIGPQDLAAGFGHLNNPGHPQVQAAIADAITRMKKAGKGAGILAFAEPDAKRWFDHGADFVAVTSDQFLLTKESSAVAGRFKF